MYSRLSDVRGRSEAWKESLAQTLSRVCAQDLVRVPPPLIRRAQHKGLRLHLVLAHSRWWLPSLFAQHGVSPSHKSQAELGSLPAGDLTEVETAKASQKGETQATGLWFSRDHA